MTISLVQSTINFYSLANVTLSLTTFYGVTPAGEKSLEHLNTTATRFEMVFVDNALKGFAHYTVELNLCR